MVISNILGGWDVKLDIIMGKKNVDQSNKAQFISVTVLSLVI